MICQYRPVPTLRCFAMATRILDRTYPRSWIVNSNTSHEYIFIFLIAISMIYTYYPHPLLSGTVAYYIHFTI